MPRNGYAVILVPDSSGQFSASMPAMPGCFSQGATREAVIVNVAAAMALWAETEAEHGRAPLEETPSVVAHAVSEALEIIDETRHAGEESGEAGYELQLVTVHPRQRIAA